MPDKSCRICGEELVKWSTCYECRKVTQKICRICSLKTTEDYHAHHISLESYKILETKSRIATIQNYSNSAYVKKPRKNNSSNRLSQMLVAFGIVVGLISMGVSGINYLGSTSIHSSTETTMTILGGPYGMIQTAKETHHVDTMHANNEIQPTYSNCLGIANGVFLTITCPTTYGDVYKAVVDIPSGLIAQFENKAFNLRNLSIIEGAYSISIQYQKKTYEAKFFNS